MGCPVVAETEAISLRQQKFTGSVLMIGAEAFLPYERPALSKEYLAGDKTFDALLLRPASYWEDKKIEVRPLRKALVWASKNANVRIVIEINPTSVA